MNIRFEVDEVKTWVLIDGDRLGYFMDRGSGFYYPWYAWVSEPIDHLRFKCFATEQDAQQWVLKQLQAKSEAEILQT